jgi:uncharacterized damage-inducible protein DinB
MELISFGRTYLLTALELCTPELLDFRPQPDSLPSGHRMLSLREQFLHIADVGELFVQLLIFDTGKPDDSWRLVDKGTGQFELSGNWPDAASIRAELEKSWAFQDEHVFSRPVADLATRIGPKERILGEEIGWLVFHESHHRGQIMLLLRLAGVEPPVW